MHYRAHYSKAKLGQHPIHPMLVAYPIAFYTGTFIAYIAYYYNLSPFIFRLGVVLNIAGVISAVLAAIPGIIDWATGVPRKHPAKKTGLVHMLTNVLALVVFTAVGWIQYAKWDQAVPDMGLSAVVFSGVGLVLTMLGGYLGWEMIGHHHVGVELSPDQARLESDVQGREAPANVSPR